jgi:hypothetical protein
MARRRADDPRQVLALGREQALALADRIGADEVQQMMQDAAAELEARLRSGITTGVATPTSITQMQAALGQVNDVVKTLARRLGRTTLDVATDAADASATSMFDYLQGAHSEFSPGRPLPIREASMFSRAVSGAQSSILRRLATTEEDQQRLDIDPDTGDMIPEQPMRPGGVLSRYGMATIGEFEAVLQRGMLTGKAWGDVRDELTSKSPFLEGAPKSWAERIVRTETMGAYNRAGWETIRAADDELGDMCKILSATFDDRTGWDSYQVHGQIRLPDEAFAWMGGLYQAPPNRPNDREVVVPHRISWPIPDELAWRSDAEVAAAWKRDRRKGSPSGRPLMTTVELARFGKPQKKTSDQGQGGNAPAASQDASGGLFGG